MAERTDAGGCPGSSGPVSLQLLRRNQKENRTDYPFCICI